MKLFLLVLTTEEVVGAPVVVKIEDVGVTTLVMITLEVVATKVVLVMKSVKSNKRNKYIVIILITNV